jgi:hypothetical protein
MISYSSYRKYHNVSGGMWLRVVSRGLEETKLPEAFWVSHQKRLFL